MDKFMGRPRSQKAAATTIEGLSDDEELLGESLAGEEEEGKAAIATTGSPILTQLLKQQKALADQIMAMCDQDF